MSEWDKLRYKYKNQNIMPSLANLDRIFAIGDRLQQVNAVQADLLREERNKLEVIMTMIENYDLLPHGERAYKLVDELLGRVGNE